MQEHLFEWERLYRPIQCSTGVTYVAHLAGLAWAECPPAVPNKCSYCDADEPTPPGLNIQDIVEANTVQAHAGRQTSAVDNSTANPQGNSTGQAATNGDGGGGYGQV